MKTKRVLAALIAALMALSLALPALAQGKRMDEPAPRFETPEGYNDNDYRKLVAFYEIEDENGVKNGEKCTDDYDPEDPNWRPGGSWEDGRLVELYIDGLDLVGELDLSGCTALEDVRCYDNRIEGLDFSGCYSLDDIMCWDNLITCVDLSGCSVLDSFSGEHNLLTELDFSDCPLIGWITCGDNMLTELDLSGKTELWVLFCSDNLLTDIDVSGCPALERMDCTGNQLKTLDLSDCPLLSFDSISTEGHGFVSYRRDYEEDCVYDYAFADSNGAEFLGWYTEDGTLIQDDSEYLYPSAANERRVVARFGEAPLAPGDANGDGVIDMTDALLVMRYALGLMNDLPGLDYVDMNGDGLVNMTDALLILRAALGIVPSHYETPEGYDDNDYQKLVAFLLTKNGDGETNAERLRWLYQYSGLDFDLNDPSTWGRIYYDVPEEDWLVFSGIIWTDEPVKRLRGINIEFEGDFDPEVEPAPCGTLDLSGCTSLESFNTISFILDRLDFSGCSSLEGCGGLFGRLDEIDLTGCGELIGLNIGAYGLSEIDISDCVRLETLQLAGTDITELDLTNNHLITWLSVEGSKVDVLDVTPCTALEMLLCGWSETRVVNAAGLTSLNYLRCTNSLVESLDVSGCTALEGLYCDGARLRELDLSDCPLLPFDNITSDGEGFIGCRLGTTGSDSGRLIAVPEEGAEFLGWFDGNDVLISNELVLMISETDSRNITALFTIR